MQPQTELIPQPQSPCSNDEQRNYSSVMVVNDHDLDDSGVSNPSKESAIDESRSNGFVLVSVVLCVLYVCDLHQ